MITKNISIGNDVLAVLGDMAFSNDGNVVIGKIVGQLDRSLYTKTNKVLDLLGGRWNRKLGGHVSGKDPRDDVADILENGFAVKELDGFFVTPSSVIDMMLSRIDLVGPVLEPSAGTGNIVRALADRGFPCVAIERDPVRRRGLIDAGFTVDDSVDDFLDYRPTVKFNTVVMNPPFENGSDAKHILHAFSVLNSGGQLISVAGSGVAFRTTKAHNELRDLIRSCGSVENLPDGSFKSSGTNVNTVLVKLNKE